MSIRTLTSLIPPPARPRNVPTDDDWARAEARLGVRLPADYKDFLSTYGEGRVGDFLGIFVPESRNQWHDLRTALEQERQVFVARRFPLRFDLFPAKPGLLPVGQTDNGDMLFYVVEGPADSWKLAFYESRGEDVEVFDGGLTEFLCEATCGRITGFAVGMQRAFTPQDE